MLRVEPRRARRAQLDLVAVERRIQTITEVGFVVRYLCYLL